MNSHIFEVTTSNFGESVDNDNGEDESVQNNRQSNRRPPISIPQKPKKGTKSYSSYTVVENFLYHPEIDFSDLSPFVNSHVEFKIEAKYFSMENKNVLSHKIYGTDYYTSNSDIVAVVLHSDLISLEELSRKNFAALSVIVSVNKTKRNYTSSERNRIVSKKLNNLNNYNGQTIKPVAYKILYSVKFDQFYKMAEKATISTHKRIKTLPEKKERQPSLRFNNVVFNMNNELAFEYNIINICDKTSNPKDFLSFLLTKYCLVIETDQLAKYVIYAAQQEPLKYLDNETYYKVMQIKNSHEFDNEYFSKHKLNAKHIVLAKDLLWEEIIWSSKTIKFKNEKAEIENPISFKFYKMTD